MHWFCIHNACRPGRRLHTVLLGLSSSLENGKDIGGVCGFKIEHAML